MSGYILSLDQSTQGTKAIVCNAAGRLIARSDRVHRQIVNSAGFVEHDPEEIYRNTLSVAAEVIKKAGISGSDIAAVGISNQRETVMAWDRCTGIPLYNAIVWQCARAAGICEEMTGMAERVREKTGINLSPYFSAPKLTWLMRNVPAMKECAARGDLCCGTMDSWLIFKLTEERAFKTDYSNASRTQLFNIHSLQWDEELCKLYEVPADSLAEVCMSDSVFGTTTLGGALPHPVPICGVLGDSHGALLGQNCRTPGSIKATYGTGSSVMMQMGEKAISSKNGLVTSLAWGLDGKVEYVLEGNLNYTGAVISWLKNDMGLLADDRECEALARRANPEDRAYFVPAFTGLGAPYWDSAATGLLTGVTRTTGRAEVVKACVDCIAYQISDLVSLMSEDSGLPVKELKVDGGPTANAYLMQLQANLTEAEVMVPAAQELSAIGAAYAAGISAGLYDREEIFKNTRYDSYSPAMLPERREKLLSGWKAAVKQALKASDKQCDQKADSL